MHPLPAAAHPLLVLLAAAWGAGSAAAVALPHRAPRYGAAVPPPGAALLPPPAAPPPTPEPAPAPPPVAVPRGRRAGWPAALLGAALCAVLAWSVGPHPEAAVWLALVPVGLLLARTDLAEHRLPDAVTLPAAAGTALLLGAAALLPGHQGSWGRALLGGLLLAAGYAVLVLANPAGMGWGDAKLAATLGLVLGWYGWRYLFAGTFLAFALGALVALPLLLARRVGRRTALPFGPFMLLGAFGGLLLAVR